MVEQQKIFCPVRRNYFLETPEELVRQKVIRLLHEKKGISYSLMAVERKIKQTKKRFDIVIHHHDSGLPYILIECKRENEQLSQAVFNQISSYNQELNVPYLVITNWNQWMAAKIEDDTFTMLSSFPDY